MEGSARAFPPYQTYHRRYPAWVDSGALRDILEVLAEDLRERGQIDLSKCYIDATFTVAKKGGGRGSHQAGQGHGTHGLGRRFWSSSGRPHKQC